MRRIILEVDETGSVYGPENWLIGSLKGNEQHFGEAPEIDDNEKQRRLMRLLDNGLKPEQIIDLKREGIL